MKQRILVAVVGIPVLLAIFIAAPAWATAVLLVLLCIIGAHELLAAVSGADKAKRGTLPASLMALLVTALVYAQGAAADSVWPQLLRWLLAASVAAVFVWTVAAYDTRLGLDFTDLCAVLAAGLAIPWAFSCLLRLRLLPDGGGMVLIPLVAAFMSDSAALFTGMACGKHKLSPKVSPHKTVEGSVGGLVGGMVGMVIFRIIFYFCTLRPLSIGWCIVIGLVGAVMGQLGDLSFSFIKRQYGIKDYGRLLPGHGGVLDRFDSVLFAAPVVWLLVNSVNL